MANETLDVFVDRVHAEALRDAALGIHEEITRKSPVDTGWFRSNWLVGVGEPPTRGDVESKNLSSAAAKQTAGLAKLMLMLVPRKVYISNYVPYATRLADGYSRQAERGWIERAIRKGLRRAGLGASTVHKRPGGI